MSNHFSDIRYQAYLFAVKVNPYFIILWELYYRKSAFITLVPNFTYIYFFMFQLNLNIFSKNNILDTKKILPFIITVYLHIMSILLHSADYGMPFPVANIFHIRSCQNFFDKLVNFTFVDMQHIRCAISDHKYTNAETMYQKWANWIKKG